jgi:hypothetical protein
MRRRDLYGMALAGLWQSKGRSLMTLAGVALGGGMLVVSLSLGHGLRTFVAAAFRKDDRLRTITVTAAARAVAVDEAAIPPGEIEVPGAMTEERRKRLRRYLIDRYRQKLPQERVTLSPERLDAIAGFDHVVSVSPAVHEQAKVTVNGTARNAGLRLLPPGHRKLADRLAFGRLPAPGAAEILVSETLLFDCGVVTDAAVEQVLGTELQLTVGDGSRGTPYLVLRLLGATAAASGLSAEDQRVLGELTDRLPAALEHLDLPPEQGRLLKSLLDRSRAGRPTGAKSRAVGTFTVVGVHYADPRDELDWFGTNPGEGELVVPAGPGRDLLARLPSYAKDGFAQAVVTVDHEENVRGV